LALSIAIPINNEELKSLWSSWKSYYSKTYGLAEEAARFAIFVENYKRIIEFNGENEDVKLALNKFADITGEEFKNLHAGCYKWDGKQNVVRSGEALPELQDSVDWRAKGAVTPVKNQGQCGSCWTFSTTGSIEGFYFINNGKLLSFSEQQIVDCDTQDDGCDGGNMNTAMEYTASNGLELESDYPYTAEDGQCKFDKSKSDKVNSGYVFVATQSADALKAAIVKQPVSIAIEADQRVFQFYSNGVIKKSCGANLDHGVLAVGYTTVSGTDAFIVKNSWGADWGQQGYVYISTDGSANNGNGVCGILAQPVVPK
jgi:C1A family cysteine protease